MELLVRSINLDGSEALHDYTMRKLQRVLRFVKDPSVRVLASLSDENGPRGGEDKSCRIRMLGPGGGLFVEATHENPYAAVDLASERLAHALRRHNERRRVGKGHLRGLRALVQELPEEPRRDETAA